MTKGTSPTEPTSHIETVRQLYSAFSRRDLAAVLAVLSPDVEWAEPDNPFNPCAGTRHGHAGFLEWARIGSQEEDILLLEPHLFLTGDHNVGVVGRARCRAKSTRRIYETDFVHLVSYKNGLVVRFQEFFDTYVAWR
jgi:ketosteroid isomerase-like protein